MNLLNPCPFCGSSEMQSMVIKENKYWTGQSSTVISVVVEHWCPRIEGQPQRHIQIAGKTKEDAIRFWNQRYNGDGPAAETDERALIK